MWGKDTLKVLFIGCHCDDIELGCGGTIHKYRNKWQMDAVVLSEMTLDGTLLKDIAKQNLTDLGVQNIYFNAFRPSYMLNPQSMWIALNEHAHYETKYDIVFSQEADDHQDHTLLFETTKRVFKKESLITYSASPLSCPSFSPNYFETLDKDNVLAKINSLKNYLEIYKDKLYMDKDLIKARMLVDGAISFNKYAEGFSIKRLTC